MAIVHAATLKPSKLELITSWLPSQPWFGGGALAQLELVGAFRFDDPAGEVGVQVLLVRADADSPIYQVPMTYRGAPLVGADDALIGETAHSVLGHRHVYDGCHDSVFVSELVRAVLTGANEVVEYRYAEGAEPVVVPPNMHVSGSGQPTTPVPALGSLIVAPGDTHRPVTVISSGGVEVSVLRVLGRGPTVAEVATLTGDWGGGESHCLATVRVDGD